MADILAMKQSLGIAPNDIKITLISLPGGVAPLLNPDLETTLDISVNHGNGPPNLQEILIYNWNGLSPEQCFNQMAVDNKSSNDQHLLFSGERTSA